MANIRQYIGARYVIKIYENSTDPSSAEWEQGNFEPLVMVTWQNGSYLSKKEVPSSVGNPALNPDYWVQTGFYNGQIASLQQQIDDINNNKLPAINLEIENLTPLNQLLENAVALKNKKICVIGDSLSFGNQWVENLKNYVGQYCEIDNYSESGKQWNDSDGSSNMCPSTLIPTLTKTYDIFIIFLGVNDFLTSCDFGDIHSATTAATFNGAIYATHEAILSHNNAAEVYCIAPTKTRFNPNPNPLQASLSMYRLSIYSHCVRYGWHYIDAYSNAPLIDISKIVNGVVGGPWLADGLHFASIYNPYFAHYVLDCIINKKHDTIGYRKYKYPVIKDGFDFLYYEFDTNGKATINLSANISNVSDSTLKILLDDMPSWIEATNQTLTGTVTETVGGTSGPKPIASLIKANNTTIYFYAAGTFTDGKIDICSTVNCKNFTFLEDFSW